ncbi:MAG TPA: type 1 glutamine amidotransferase domain-containing protein [Ktedonobacteraceae bacterium]|nr:type 1 glutamine amidotransferase domain-containing protein [Ktedonobacteraceae bacterium]
MQGNQRNQGNQLGGMRVAILVDTNFEQVEMTEPRKALEQAGAKTVLISPQSGEVQGMNHDQMGQKFKVDMQLDQANPDDFDAVVVPGGALNADKLRMVEKARDFVIKMDEKNKPMAVICHGPWLLVSSNLVNGRTLTSYYTLQDDIRNAGGHWLDESVVRDRNLVTSRFPQDIPNFNKAMIELFMEAKSGKLQQQYTQEHVTV